ncbi:spermidine/putrescine ABC transporter ATP-binding protein PotA [Geovibrio ferrireducens]|uniref:spermidine/putrescine ABC transporter ATP-binding protein PotA n=1 Tax=Geovibrio ferrireducens TaxID=46201 RepID=UPI0022456A67|nr:spermidine/putrescine ABC transporter ATP-binding protein PotA [Geovibrio ferrireducens]
MKHNAPIIELNNITKSFGDNTILKNLNLSISDGEFVTLLGPSGCGKTTILRLIAGFEQPDEGRILLAGDDITDLPSNKRHVNTVFQSYALFPHMTVFENVAFGLNMDKMPKSEIKTHVDEVLRMVKMSEYADRKPSQLSGGQQQRVAIARAVVKKPRILLLDEPLSALDFKLRKQMQVELKQLQRRLGITFIFVTHDQEEALSMSDRVIVMDEGVIQQSGTPKQVYEQPANLFVARFVGEINILDSVVEKHTDNGFACKIEGFSCEIHTKKRPAEGVKVNILLRPEDLRVAELAKTEKPEAGSIFGRVEETTYKGATLESIIVLPSGKKLLASEFFDEEYEEFDYKLGQDVAVSWVGGWEVVLADE